MKAQGEFAQVQEQLVSAIDTAGQPVKRGTMAHDHDLYASLVDAAARRGDLAAIRKFGPQIETLAERDGHMLYLAIAHRALGIGSRLSGEFDAAYERLALALSLFTELDTRWQIGCTLLEIAEVQLARPELGDARDTITRSLDLFETIHAAPDAQRAQRMLISLLEGKGEIDR